jgi:hypothetical protein
VPFFAQLARSPHATVALEVFHPPSPLVSQAKSQCVQRSCLPTAAALPVSKEMGLHRNRQSVVACNRRGVRPRIPTLPSRSSALITWRPQCSGETFVPLGGKGPSVLQTLGSRTIVVKAAVVSTRGRKDATCADDLLPLVRRWQAP